MGETSSRDPTVGVEPTSLAAPGAATATLEATSPWALDPAVDFLNHGSFGSCPRPVLEVQRRLRERLEAEPVDFLARELETMLDEARARLATFIGADPEELAFVTNATTAVNTVLRSLRFDAGDELLTTDHEYNACLNALQAAAAQNGARVVIAELPLPVESPEQVTGALLAAVTSRTRLALVSHVTSPTGLVLPIEPIVAGLQEQGVDVLVDGAHAPGMVPLDLDALGAAYYTGNHHKWLCAPKGSGFLHVRRDRQDGVRPLVISHGANDPRSIRSRFRKEFDWTGTADPTAHLSVPAALDFMAGLEPGGWPAVMAANRELALRGLESLRAVPGVVPVGPRSMIGSMAAVLLPAGGGLPAPGFSPLDDDPLQMALREQYRIEVPIGPWPLAWKPLPDGEERRRLLRISAQRYNHPQQYDRLAAALAELLAA
jgi:isopenicillin-N epimerase